MGKRPQTDPTTLSGKQGDLGGGGALELLNEKSIEDEIESREFSEPNSSAPSNISTVWDSMEGSGTGEDPKVITTDRELQAIENDLSASYVLGANIDCSDTRNWNSGMGFSAIGSGYTSTTEFKGKLDGKGRVIKGLYSEEDDYISNAGLMAIGDSTTDDVVVENIVMYDCTSITNGSKSGVLAADCVANGAPDQYRRKIRDILVVNSYAKAEREAGGITAYTSIATDVENCAVVNTTLVTTTSNSHVGSLFGVLGGYDWGSGDQSFNYSVFKNIYSYNNEIITGGDDTGGVIAGHVYVNSDIESSTEFLTDVNSVVISGDNEDIPLIGGLTEEGSGGASGFSISSVYTEGHYTPIGTLSSAGNQTVDVTSLSKDKIRGESVVSKATDLDFTNSWSTVSRDKDLSLFADGLPVLQKLEGPVQTLGQGLGDPLSGDFKGVNKKGRLINVSLGTEKETNPLRTTFPGDYRVGSKVQKNGGVLTTLQNVPQPAEDGAAVVDPQDPESIVYIGGQKGDETGGVPVRVYDTRYDEWDGGKYPDLDSGIADVTRVNRGTVSSSSNNYVGFGACYVGETIYLFGGSWVDPGYTVNSGHPTDQIYKLTTTSGSVSWSLDSETIPTERKSCGVGVVDSEIYIFGGKDSNFSSVNGVTKYSPGASSGSRVSSVGTSPERFLKPPATLPTLSSEVYITGEGGGSSDVFYKYSPETESFTELSNVSVLEGSGGGGSYRGVMAEVDGIIVYIPQSSHNVADVGLYSVENDMWVGRSPPKEAEAKGLLGSNTGALVDGVIYSTGTDSDEECLMAYIPEEEPFGGN